MPAELAPAVAVSEVERLFQAEALVRGFCGWHVAPSRTETFKTKGSGSSVHILPSLHVTAVASVTSDGELVDPEIYDWSPAGVLTNRGGRWCGRVVSVTFTHGHVDPPAEVTAIVQAVAQRAIQNPGSLTKTQVGPFADAYSLTGSNEVATLALLSSEKQTLSRYKLPPRP